MQVRYMTLDGRVNQDAFIEEWAKSHKHDATFLQTEDALYLMPYGQHSLSREAQPGIHKFTGAYRSHRALRRDFEIFKENILGGGYLKLSEDRKSCSFVDSSTTFGGVPDEDAVVDLVISNLLQRK